MIPIIGKLVHLLKAPVFEDEYKTRIAGLLNIILLVGLALVIAAGVINTSFSPVPFPQFFATCALLIWLLTHYILFRRGFVKLVSLLLPYTMWSIIILLVLFSGGITSPNLAGFIPLILGVGLIFGLRNGILVTVASILAGLVVLAIQEQGLLPEQLLVYRPINVWAVYFLWFTLTALLLHVGTKEITTALRQARFYAHQQSSLANQQSAIARTGQAALEATDLATLFDLAARQTAHTLNVEYSCILKMLPVGDRLLLAGGFGWKEGLVGKLHVKASDDSKAGYILRQSEPVIVVNLHNDDRFPTPPLLAEHRVTSGVCVVIRSPKKPLGILGVYTNRQRGFQDDEIYFLEAMANILATTIEQLQAEEALVESERKYRNILESIEEGYFEVDLEGNLTFFNDSVCRMAQIPREELMGMNNREFTSPETARKIYQVFNSVFRTGKPASVLDYEMVRKDGSKLIIEVSVSLRRDSAGEPIGFRGVVRDITERTITREALRESEERYRRLFEEAQDGIFLADAETGILIDCNRAAANLVKRDISELIGQHQKILHPPTEIEGEFSVSFKKHLESYKGQVLEEKVITSGGEIREVAIKANLLHFGSRQLLLGMFRDITERKRAEEALRESEQMLREIHTNATEGIFRTTPEGKVLYANEAIAKMFGYESVDEFLDINVEDMYFNPEERQHALLPYKTEDHIQNLELHMRRRDGSEFWVQENAVVVRDDKGNIKWYEGFLSDITDRKEAEKALNRSEEQLRQAQKMEAVGQLAGGIAHDFNNVLSQISAATELLETHNENRSLDRYLDILQGSVERGKSVTERILRFSRKREPRYESSSVKDILVDIVKVIEHTFPKNINVKLKRYTGKDSVWGDTDQLHLVFMNLCLNAADAMPNGGKLTLNIHKPRAGEVEQYFTRSQRNYLCVTVSDTGIGMDTKTAAQVFDPFFSTKDPGKGTGLGLAVAYKIIMDHKGWIGVKSIPDQGSSFTIGLPLSDKEPKIVSKVAVEPQLQGNGEHILIVEDEPAFRALLGEALKSRDYTVSLAENGAEAWEFIEEHIGEVNLVITDLGMPEMDGKELARRLHTEAPEIRIIISSGYIDPDELAELKGYGVQDFCYKPNKLSDLVHTVAKVLSR